MARLTRATSGAVALLALAILLATLAPALARAQGDGQLVPTDDPRYVYGSFIGGNRSDYGRAIAVDAQGFIYVALDSFSTRDLYGGSGEIPNAGGTDVVVAKLRPDGKTLVKSFAFGGPGGDRAIAMAVTRGGEVVLTVLPGGPWPTYRARIAISSSPVEGALVKLNAALDGFVFSTMLGMELDTEGDQNVALDSAGFIYVTGNKNAALTVQKHTPDGQALRYETMLGGPRSNAIGRAIAVGPDGAAYVAGTASGYESSFPVTSDALQPACADGENRTCVGDAVLVVLDPGGATRYASYHGGAAGDSAVGLARDGQGGIVVIGHTSSTDFPTTPGAPLPRCKTSGDSACYYDTFLTRFSPDGRRIIYSTYLGSDEPDTMDFTSAIAADGQGNVVVTGYTAGERFPLARPVQSALNATPCASWFTRFCYDSFVARVGPSGALSFATYLGGLSDDYAEGVAVGPDGDIIVVGTTESYVFPITAGAGQPLAGVGDNGFLLRFDLTPGTGGGPPAAGPHSVYLPLLVISQR